MRGARTGRVAAIAAFVAAHPGCTAPQIEARLEIGPRNGLLAYCVGRGLVFTSGRRRFYRYYATAELARAHDAQHRAEAEKARAEARARVARKDQIRKRAKRHDAGATPVHTRPRDGIVRIDPEVRIAGDVKVTIAKAPPGRFEVVGPFVGQITQDWLQRLPAAARARFAQEKRA